ncbi:hypothetical protein PARPLA_01503 [Rhodobacteraceae bacterium THAF1]|uniref:hypothetical protein n=1 Tax=Palleronia sp. THAF1 TaxID=2587842 RepID=UPI000F3BFAA5|nr:hypothetical protein [Palleronia sp. THAF1]QFU07588.1 hypothetical protein FIU81_02740 [Palleronia sp. THAF1]VDC22840.1 hypothetical protein PARPLA_01503 [Rhodobacteraceae bacterium THAF1]
MRWLFRIVFALIRGGSAFAWLTVAGWLFLVTPDAEERHALGSAFQDTRQGSEQVATMRLARMVLAVAPDATIATMTRLAPGGISADQLRTALEVVAQGPGAASMKRFPVTGYAKDAPQGLARFDLADQMPQSPAPPQIRRVGGAKFMRPPE